MATSRSSRAARSSSACRRVDEPLLLASSMASARAPATAAPRVLRSRENQRSVNWSINGNTTKAATTSATSSGIRNRSCSCKVFIGWLLFAQCKDPTRRFACGTVRSVNRSAIHSHDRKQSNDQQSGRQRHRHTRAGTPRAQPESGDDRQLRRQRVDRQPWPHRLVLHAALRRRPGVPCAAGRIERRRRRRPLQRRIGVAAAHRAGLRPWHGDRAHAAVRRLGPGHRDRRLRAALQPARAHLPAGATGAPRAPAQRPPAGAHRRAAARRMGQHHTRADARQQPPALRAAGHDAALEHQRTAHLRGRRHLVLAAFAGEPDDRPR